MVVKPLELGLPEGKPPKRFTLAEKYGADSTHWPVWAKPHYDPSHGMLIDEVSLFELVLNGRLLNDFDSIRHYTSKDWAISGGNSNWAYYQNGLIFSLPLEKGECLC